MAVDLTPLTFLKRSGASAWLSAMRQLFPVGMIWDWPLGAESNIDGIGIPSSESFGAHSIIWEPLVIPSGIVSGEAFGVAGILFKLYINGIASAEVIGDAAVGFFKLLPLGIVSGEQVSQPGINVAAPGGNNLTWTENSDTMGYASGEGQQTDTTDVWIQLEMKLTSAGAYIRSDVGHPGTFDSWLQLNPEAAGTPGDSFLGACLYVPHDEYPIYLDVFEIIQGSSAVWVQNFEGTDPLDDFLNLTSSPVSVVTSPIDSPNKCMLLADSRSGVTKLVRQFTAPLVRADGDIFWKVRICYPRSYWEQKDEWREKNQVYFSLFPDNPNRGYQGMFRPSLFYNLAVQDHRVSSIQVTDWS